MHAICEPEVAISAQPPSADAQAILNRQSIMPAQTSSVPTRIVLTGFMGAGKTTVGRELAQRLGWRFLDVDEQIVTKAGMPVAEVFAKYGEFVFRRMETSAVAHALGEQEAVIALGGGAVEVLANRLLLEQTPRTRVVFLEAPLPVLLERCQQQADAAERPNLTVAEERFRYRAPLYKRVANLRIDTTGQSVEESATALMQLFSASLSPSTR